jgi:hypothetical protein
MADFNYKNLKLDYKMVELFTKNEFSEIMIGNLDSIEESNDLYEKLVHLNNGKRKSEPVIEIIKSEIGADTGANVRKQRGIKRN